MNFENIKELYNYFCTSEKGLSDENIISLQEKYGKNILPQKKVDWLKLLLTEFNSPLVFILLGAIFILVLLPFLENGFVTLHDLLEPFVIFFILFVNGLIGFFQALKSENAIESLKQLQPEYSSVLRNNQLIKIKIENIVVGDIIYLGEGEKIPADIIITKAVSCTTNESLLTGESNSINKKDIFTTPEIEESYMLYSGSQILSGRIEGVVSAIALNTKIGQIANMIKNIEKPISPMQHKLEKLSKKIGLGMIFLCLLVFLLSVFRDIYWLDAMFTSIALAVAAVPEGLPAVMTISLAIGVSIMAKKNVLVRDIKSIESLGSVTVIASDKTGTITQNKMSMEKVWHDNIFVEKNKFSSLPKIVFEISNNCNDAVLPNIGDPTEIALLEVSSKHNIKKYDRVDEVPFSSEKKWMSTSHIIQGENITFVKGAPEIVSLQCDPKLVEKIKNNATLMAEEGLRTLAFATKKEGEKYAKFICLVGLQDPPRPTVRKSIEEVKNAGVRTVMITGDHAVTAKSIAKQVGINSEVVEGIDLDKMKDFEINELVKKCSIFARVSPKNKVQICKALQSNGEIVAMTGDGVNDAPAISQAEVGISMGVVGTSVARSASDIILLDDNFSSIVKGIKEGRRVFDNIKKSITFLVATNLAEVLVLLTSLLIGLPIALIPIHILFINLLTDSIPALALATESAEKNIMNRSPRPKSEGFFTDNLLLITFLGFLVSSFVLFLFSLSINDLELSQSQTLAFVSLSIFELGVIFSLRTNDFLFKFNSFNKWVFLSAILVISITIGVLFSPLAPILKLDIFPTFYWLYIFVGFFVVLFILETFKYLKLKVFIKHK
jgi:Ca2+-transporting ATPase